jgi:hypothetical protein
MLNPCDHERLVKSRQAATLLIQDLRELIKAADPLLSDFALEILQQAVVVEQRLCRIEAVTGNAESFVRNVD